MDTSVSSSQRLFPKALCKRCWGDVAKARVTPLAVVENLDVLLDWSLYGTQVPPDLISTITDEVMEEVVQWQQRPLEPMYPIVYFDAPRLKIRDEGTVKNKAVYLALGIRADGRKEVLGLWIEQTEGAKFCKRPTLPPVI